LAHIPGQATDYLVRWTWPLSLFIAVLAAWALVLLLRPRPATAWIGVGVLAVWAVVMVPSVVGVRPPHDEFADATDALIPATVDWVEAHGGGPVAVRSEGGQSWIPPALVLGLERAGEDVVADREVPLTLVVAGPEARERLAADPRNVLVAEHPGDPADDRMPPLAVFARLRR
jgi:hypothetical protein